MYDNLINIYFTHKWKIYTSIFIILLIWSIFSSLLPQIMVIIENNSEIENNRFRIEQAENWGSVVGHLKTENKKLKTLLQDIYIKAPQNDELSQIMSLLSDAAKKTDVNYSTINPQDVKIFNGYRVVPIILELNCSYHDFAKFLNFIETSKNVIKVEQFNIKTDDFVSSKLNVLITILVLYLNKT